MSEDGDKYRYLLVEASPAEIDVLAMVLREKLGYRLSETHRGIMTSPEGGQAAIFDSGQVDFSPRAAGRRSSAPRDSEPPP